MASETKPDEPVIIKKYANRRLYNTGTSSYITLEHLAAMVREDREFKVVDAKSGDDITHMVLTQIIVDEEGRSGQTMLPVSFLRQLISMYGNSLQAMVPQYLEASMAAFHRNQAEFQKAFGGLGNPAFAPFEEMAKQNMKMFEAATGMFGGGTAKGGPAQETSRDEISELKAQMAALQKQLEKLANG